MSSMAGCSTTMSPSARVVRARGCPRRPMTIAEKILPSLVVSAAVRPAVGLQSATRAFVDRHSLQPRVRDADARDLLRGSGRQDEPINDPLRCSSPRSPHLPLSGDAPEHVEMGLLDVRTSSAKQAPSPLEGGTVREPEEMTAGALTLWVPMRLPLEDQEAPLPARSNHRYDSHTAHAGAVGSSLRRRNTAISFWITRDVRVRSRSHSRHVRGENPGNVTATDFSSRSSGTPTSERAAIGQITNTRAKPRSLHR